MMSGLLMRPHIGTRKSSYYKSIIEALKHFNSYLKSEKNKNECKVTKLC